MHSGRKPENTLVTPQRDDIDDSRVKAGRLERLAWILDSAIRIPGTNYRIGVDGVLGLIPGFGDLVGALLSSYILASASQIGVPLVVLIRMALNIALESIVGAIPILGDIFDFVWKANQRNVKLLNYYLQKPDRATTSSRLVVTIVIVFLVFFLVALGAIVYWILSALLQAIHNQ